MRWWLVALAIGVAGPATAQDCPGGMWVCSNPAQDALRMMRQRQSAEDNARLWDQWQADRRADEANRRLDEINRNLSDMRFQMEQAEQQRRVDDLYAPPRRY